MLKYKKYHAGTKERVIKRYLEGVDWKLTAQEHGVPLQEQCAVIGKKGESWRKLRKKLRGH
jgi:hypothetical protein